MLELPVRIEGLPLLPELLRFPLQGVLEFLVDCFIGLQEEPDGLKVTYFAQYVL